MGIIELMSQFRETLKAELQYQGIRVKELSQKSGVAKRTIDHYLAEQSSEPLAESAVKIAVALGVSAEYLVTGTESGLPKGLSPQKMRLLNKIAQMDSSNTDFLWQIIERLEK